MVCICPPRNEATANTYLAGMFNTCVYNTQEMVSLIFSWVSLIIWACSQWPPIRMNFLLQDSSALSAFLCFVWMFTDLVNLISNFLLNMMIGQKILSILWFVMDLVLVLQVLLYSIQKRRAYKAAGVYPLPPIFSGLNRKCGKKRYNVSGNGDSQRVSMEQDGPDLSEVSTTPLIDENRANNDAESTNLDETGFQIRDEDGYRYNITTKNRLLAEFKKFHTFDMSLLTQKEQSEYTKKRSSFSKLEICCYVLIFGIIFSNLGWAGKEGDTALKGDTTGMGICQSDNPPSTDSPEYITGTVISYICPVFYTVSRIGQIIKNCKRKSVIGLSLGLFISSLLANLTQATSLIIFSWEVAHQVRSLPFVAGALLPMVCDIIILCQARKYNKLAADIERIKKVDECNTNTDASIIPEDFADQE